MTIDWAALKKEMSPIPCYEDLARRWIDGLGYTFVRRHYDFSLVEIEAYTLKLLGGDTHGRYNRYVQFLTGAFHDLGAAGVSGIFDLFERAGSEEKFSGFVLQNGLDPKPVIGTLKYLVYWVIPDKKQVRELVSRDPRLVALAAPLRATGIRYNLDLLEQGCSPEGRAALAQASGLPGETILDLVNRADFSRFPWTSSATIANLIGSGYASLSQVINTGLEQISADFYRYGVKIGKNLKLGNEIESIHRIARILPRVVQE